MTDKKKFFSKDKQENLDKDTSDIDNKTESEITNNNEETEEKLEETIESELETMKNQYIRLAADFDNYRKRHAQERESLLKYGAEDTLKKLLPVIDTLERAQKSIACMDDCEKIKESINIFQKQLMESLEKAGLQKIEAVGKEFDPVYHEAVMQTPSADSPDHTVIAELQTGYKLGERVLRPTLVNVAIEQ